MIKLYKFSVVYAMDYEDDEDFDFYEMIDQIKEVDVEPKEICDFDDIPEGWHMDCTPFGDSHKSIQEILLENMSKESYCSDEYITINGVKYKKVD